MRDIYSYMGYVQAIPPQDVTAAVMGLTIDRTAYGGGAHGLVFIVNVGAGGGALVSDAGHFLYLQHASESAGGIDAWEDVPISMILHSVLGAGGPNSTMTSGIWQSIYSTTSYASQTYFVGYIGDKRYVRQNVSVIGAPSAYKIGAIALLGKTEIWPVNVPVGI